MNIRQSIWVGLLLLLGMTSLSGCSQKAPEEAPNIKEGFGKTVDPYETKNGKVGAPQPGARAPYTRPPGK